MLAFSLKWRIFLFYIVFGLLPLAVVSIVSVQTYTQSVEKLTEKQVTELVERAAAQTNTHCYNLFKELDILSKFPYVQLSFLQFPYGKRLSSLGDNLEIFRINSGNFQFITLYSNDGLMVAQTPNGGTPKPGSQLDPARILSLGKLNYFHLELKDSNPPYIVFFKEVRDFQDPQRPVGLVSGGAPLENFINFTKKLAIGEGIQKNIVTAQGESIFSQKPSTAVQSSTSDSTKSYLGPVPLLDWTIVISIPEHILFKDVNRLKLEIIAFAAFVALVAVAASLFFSRVVINPLRKIIIGTKEFAAGNLDYRINIKHGVEAKQVAEEFNLMAHQLKERERELIQAGKLASLGLLSAGLAHEVKNPLASIKTSAQVVQRHSQDEDTRSLTRGISEEVDRLNKIVTDLLNFSPPRPSRKIQCNLAEVVDHSLGLIKAEIDRKNVQVIKQLQNFSAWVDSGQMIQVVLNLLLNALAAVKPQEGMIRIETSIGQNGERLLTIADNGHGIPSEKLSGIFDPFFSLSKEGTGLGLSIVHTLLTQNDVKINVTSRVDVGTKFTLRFKLFKDVKQEVAHG